MTEWESVEPPAELEERVVRTLRHQGWLRTAGRAPRRLARWWVWPAALAAGLLLFIGGFALGRHPATAETAGRRQYTLLLYEGPGFNPAGVREPALVREYTAWAGALAGRGQLVGGEKLGANEWTLGADPAGPFRRPAGFFVIAARDDAEALAIARTCPHLRHGGTISVRPIEPT
ncbi:MAG TPA: hypothetical protein VHJ69_01830 [Gemmatimonadales bacterium]|nr:hypothetical protein [Gemmatimonadales bacterium]